MYPRESSAAWRNPKLRHGRAEPGEAFSSFSLDQSAESKVNQCGFFFFARELAGLGE
jgi:hypothetical protein